MENEKKTFKQIRKEKGISATFVATKLHISTQALYNKEQGKHKFSFPEGVILLRLYNVTIDDVLV